MIRNIIFKLSLTMNVLVVAFLVFGAGVITGAVLNESENEKKSETASE